MRVESNFAFLLIMWQPEDAVPPAVQSRLEALHARDAPPAAYLAAFLELISLLKSQKRTGWIGRDITSPESIADHMYRMSVACMMTTNKDIDIGKAVRIAICHDMAEALVGDLTPYSGVPKAEKRQREHDTMKYFRDLISKFNPAAGAMIYDFWNEYENQTSTEAQLVKDIDRFELLAQADEYQRAYPHSDLAEFQRVESLIKSDEVKSWARGLKEYQR